jgi:hypothetical protein
MSTAGVHRRGGGGSSGGASLLELHALLGALRELQGSSSWAVQESALASLDEALTVCVCVCLCTGMSEWMHTRL